MVLFKKCVSFFVVIKIMSTFAYQGGTFAFIPMDYSKQPIDHIQQIEILKERGLLIQDEEKALNQLQIISYFRLANYWRPMEEDKTIHLFKPNSYFENALSLYYFDTYME